MYACNHMPPLGSVGMSSLILSLRHPSHTQCPHDAECPLRGSKSHCHFAQRVQLAYSEVWMCGICSMCACVRACVRACMRACVCLHECVRACVH